MGSKLKPYLLAMVVLFIAAVSPLQAQNGTVTGVVTYEATGRPVATASVEAVAQGGRIVGSTLTTNEGRYSLSVAPGNYEITVNSIGFEVARVVNVAVTAGGTTSADVTLQVKAFEMDPVNVTAQIGVPTEASHAPQDVAVISESEIERRPGVTPADLLANTQGVDIVRQGVQSTNVVVRGFNNIFSGALLTLSDYRLAGVPSLRVNLLHFIPSTSEDLQQVEVLLGPAAALYGPNTASGVLHFITKSPLTHDERSISFMAGQQDILQGNARIAHRFNDRVGFKVSGMMLSATEWPSTDPDEIAERAKFLGADSVFFRQDMMSSTGVSDAEARRRIALIGNRDRDITRWSGDARLDWQVSDNATAIFQSGITNVGSAVELTGLGAGQVDNWRYSYYQGRFNWNRLFAQAYLNTSNAGDTYLLRTGQPIVDESTLLAGQLRHGFQPWTGQDLTYGVDVFKTTPKTQGTINGAYEDEDETTEVGAYLQSQTTIHPKLDLFLTGRVDDHSALPDLIFSPRAALVFRPAEQQTIRATYNRAFSTPTSLNQFLDLPTSIPNQGIDPRARGAATLGFSVRVQGTGQDGFAFRQAGGGYLMRVPALLGGPAGLLPANVAPFFPAAFGVANQNPTFQQQVPLPVRQYLGGMTLTPAELAALGTNFIRGSESLPIAGLTLDRIAPIRETTTSSFELGYKGVIRERFSVGVDAWFNQIDDFVTPLTTFTPLLALNGPSIAGVLVPRFMTDLGMDQATAVQVATGVATAMAGVPLGVISSPEVNATGAQILASYTNVPESIDVWGMDVSLQALLADSWRVTLVGSFVSDDHFDSETVGTVTLNAPTRKGALALEYQGVDNGFTSELRARYNGEFPVQSGVFTGTSCIDDGPNPCVKSYTLVDATVGYAIPQLRGTTVQLSVQNLFDETYRSYPGVADVGRLALLRLRYEF